MRYVLARFQSEQREETYRFYIAEGIRVLTENTTGKEDRTYMNKSLYDILSPKPQITETRSGKEIANDIRNKMKKLGGG